MLEKKYLIAIMYANISESNKKKSKTKIENQSKEENSKYKSKNQKKIIYLFI